MNIRGTVLWPVYRLAGWVDDNPLSAAGIIIAFGGLGAMLAAVGVEVGPGATIAYEGISGDAVVETVTAQPAYAVAALFGFAVFVLYDG